MGLASPRPRHPSRRSDCPRCPVLSSFHAQATAFTRCVTTAAFVASFEVAAAASFGISDSFLTAETGPPVPTLQPKSAFAAPPESPSALAPGCISGSTCDCSSVGVAFVQMDALVMFGKSSTDQQNLGRSKLISRRSKKRAWGIFALTFIFCIAVVTFSACFIRKSMKAPDKKKASSTNSNIVRHSSRLTYDFVDSFLAACGRADSSESSGALTDFTPSQTHEHGSDDSVGFPRVKETTETTLRYASETFQQDGSKSYGFSWVFVFPLPSATTSDDENEWKRRFSSSSDSKDSRRDQLLATLTHGPNSSHVNQSFDCGDSLAAMRNCVIEMIHTLVTSVSTGSAPIEVFCFTSVDNDELFMCIKMSDACVLDLAEKFGKPVQLSVESLARLKIQLPQKDEKSTVTAYTPYTAALDEQGFFRSIPHPAKGTKSVFRQLDQIILIRNLIDSYLNVNGLMRLACMSQAFPAHDVQMCRWLSESWARITLMWSLEQPIHQVRNYFGERTAFYFLFVEKLCKVLPLLLVVTLPLSFSTSFPDAMNPSVRRWIPVCFCVYIVIWYMCFTKYWSRTQALYANVWGTDSLENTAHGEINRSFNGRPKPSPMNLLQKTLQADPVKRGVGITISVIVTILFVSLIFISVAWNIQLGNRMFMSGKTYALTLSGISLSVQIQVFNFIWTILSTKLTDGEQIVMEEKYDESQNLKLYVVYFINFFAASFYVAFIQEHVAPETCGPVGGCLTLLRHNTVTMFLSAIAFGILDMLIPMASYKFNIWWEARNMTKSMDLSFLEQQGKMPAYDLKAQFDDHFQVLAPLSFLVFFGVQSPVLTLGLSYFAIRVQLRADAWKLVHVYQRIMPRATNGIGIWSWLLRINEYVCIAVNSGQIASFFSDAFRDISLWKSTIGGMPDNKSELPKLLLFFVLCVLFLVLRAVLDTFVSDVPATTQLTRERQKLQLSRLQSGKAHAVHRVELHGTPDIVASALDTIPPLQPGSVFFANGLI
eukprot:TRINITY_DN41120_c0_g1_i1.p1 TRINITY_DN41120_c0_g1~~TRINITY_DN41120_c0_g1_i1.p1  ORF type:complete len:996 (+),score=107.74 TRINITY_DN41120_c0_g1_i1:48-3035(+)